MNTAEMHPRYTLKNRLFFHLQRTVARLPKVAREALAAGFDRWLIHSVIETGGVKYRFDVRRNQLFLLNDYETELFDCLTDQIEPGDVCLDIGAHVGRVSLFMAKKVGASGKVMCVEPMQSNYELLLHNISVNRLNRTVSAWHACCADEVGECELLAEDTSFRASIHERCDGVPVRVDAMTIDSLCAGEERPCNMIKVDVEGAEADVLRGAQRTLKSVRPKVLVEMHPPYSGEVPGIMSDAGYRACGTDGRPLDGLALSQRAAGTDVTPFHVLYLPDEMTD